MSLRLKSVVLAAFGFFLLSIPAFSQVTAIEGIVKDEADKPLQGAVIDIERTDIKGHYSVKTDKKGHYGHYGLPIGNYDVQVLVDGKVRDGLKGVHTSPSNPIVHDFPLKAAAQSQQATQKALETGTLSKEQERGMTKEQKDAFDKAAKAREKDIAKNKELNDSFQAGKAALEAKQYDVAIASFTKGSELDPKQPAVWSNLADAYAGKAQATPAEAAADYDKAFDAYKKTIELTPEDAGIYNNYALALASDKKLDEAKVNLNKAAQLQPDGAGKYYYNLGALLVNGGQGAQAEEEFKKAIDADPNYADAQYQYGMALSAKANVDAKTGKVEPAPGTVEALQKYLELKPDGANAASAKEMIAALGGSVSTTYGTQKAKPAAAPKKK